MDDKLECGSPTNSTMTLSTMHPNNKLHRGSLQVRVGSL